MPKEENVFYQGEHVYYVIHRKGEAFCLKFEIAEKKYVGGQPAKYRLELAHPDRCQVCNELATKILDGQFGCSKCTAEEIGIRVKRNVKREAAGQELLDVTPKEHNQEGFSDYIILKPLIDTGQFRDLTIWIKDESELSWTKGHALDVARGQYKKIWEAVRDKPVGD